MSLETDLTAALQALCPRVYPDVAPLGVQRPYVIYQQVGGDALTYTEGTLPDKRNARMQITVWADTRLAATALALSIEAALAAAPAFAAYPEGALRGAYDEGAQLRGAEQDFSIWAAR